MESEVAVDGEVGVGAVGTDSHFLLHADGWSDPMATSSTPHACKSCRQCFYGIMWS